MTDLHVPVWFIGQLITCSCDELILGHEAYRQHLLGEVAA